MIEELSALYEQPSEGTGVAQQKAKKIRTRNKVKELAEIMAPDQMPFFKLYVFTSERDMQLKHDSYLIKEPAQVNRVLKHIRDMRSRGIKEIGVGVAFVKDLELARSYIVTSDPECIVHFDDVDYICKTLDADFDRDHTDDDGYINCMITELDKFEARAAAYDTAAAQEGASNQNDVVDWIHAECEEMARIFAKEPDVIKKMHDNKETN
jgi:hypothetical protein